jgi:16S rRNA G1207 methylase RsmC
VDCVVLNPPFSEGRWSAHIKAAYSLLNQHGRLVAILPASALGKELIAGACHEFSEVFDNQFAGTSISVVIVKITLS